MAIQSIHYDCTNFTVSVIDTKNNISKYEYTNETNTDELLNQITCDFPECNPFDISYMEWMFNDWNRCYSEMR